jgi:hypothetical protein
MKKIALFLIAMILFSYSVVFADIINPDTVNSGEEQVVEEVETVVEDVTTPSGSTIEEATNEIANEIETEPVVTEKSPSPLGAVIAIVVVLVIVLLVAFIAK